MPFRQVVVIALCAILCWLAVAPPGFSDLTGSAPTAATNGSAETPSHRILPPPDTGTIDFSQQLQVLQQLQSLFSPKSDALNPVPKITPEQLKQMQTLLKGLGGPQPIPSSSDGGTAPKPPVSPPGDAGSQVPMQRLLERFLRNRTLPQRNSTGQEQTIAPTSDNSGKNPDRPGDPDRFGRPETPDADAGGPPETTQPRSPSSARTMPPQNPNSAPQGRPGTGGRPGQRGRAGTSGPQRPVDGNPGIGSPESGPDAPASRIAGRDDPSIAPGPRTDQEKAAGSGSAGARRSTPARRPAAASAPKAQATGRPGSDLTPESVESELQRNGFERTFERILDQARRKSQSSPDRRGMAPGSSAKQEDTAALAEEMRSAIVRAIDGVRENVAKAGEQPGSATPAGSAASPAAAAGPIRPSESASATPQTRPGGRPRSSGGRSGSSQEREPESQENSAVATAGQKAGEWISSLLRATEPPSAAATPDTEVDSEGTTDASTPSPSTSGTADRAAAVRPTAGTVFAMLMGLAVLVLLQRHFRRRRSLPAADLRRNESRIPSGEIHSRGDLVEAFHQFALSCTGLTREWWTHREFVRRLLAVSPSTATAVDELADVYEQARYLPGHVELTVHQMSQARAALERCQAVNTRALTTQAVAAQVVATEGVTTEEVTTGAVTTGAVTTGADP